MALWWRGCLTCPVPTESDPISYPSLVGLALDNVLFLKRKGKIEERKNRSCDT